MIYVSLRYSQKKGSEADPVVYALFGQWAAGEKQTLPLAQVKPVEGKSAFTLIDGDKGQPLTYTTHPQNGTVILNLPVLQPQNTFIIWTVRMQSIQPV